MVKAATSGSRSATAGAPPAEIRIDLGALDRNLAVVCKRSAPARVLAVVKADAYGHGAAEVALRLERGGVEWFGVGSVEEGRRLRRAGIEAAVLVMGATDAAAFDAYRDERLTPTISGLAQLADWRRTVEAAGVPSDFHLKVDSGMSRLGLMPGELPQALAVIRATPLLRMTGFMSHLAESDAPASPWTPRQLERFDDMLELLTDAERSRVLVHLANSGAALAIAGARRDLVRAGLALYGLDPVGDESELEPVMSVVARVALLREVEAGTRVGYGGTWTATRATELAVVPVGYGDGYSWRLSSRAQALVGGRRVPVVGRVSMDMTALDVTGGGVRRGDEVVLLGRQGDERIDAKELATAAGTIAWETLCVFALRLPRVYQG